MSGKNPEKNFKIDFIGIGAPRCATTWISKCLSEHPQICFSSVKEIHFFDKDYNYKKGLDFYKSFFKHCNSKKIKGEFTPSYFLDEKVAKRIRKFFPDVKLLICLRNPIERAFSHYMYDKKRFIGAVDEDFLSEIKKNSRYLKDGFYFSYLNKFLKHFNSDNVLVLIYEDIAYNPFGFIKKIYRFLGVNENFIPPSLYQKVNSSKNVSYKIPYFNPLINITRKKMKKFWVGRIVLRVLKFVGLNKVVKHILRLNLYKNNKPTKLNIDKENINNIDLNVSIRKTLRDIYNEDIKNLEKLIKRKLDFWV